MQKMFEWSNGSFVLGRHHQLVTKYQKRCVGEKMLQRLEERSRHRDFRTNGWVPFAVKRTRAMAGSKNPFELPEN